MNKDEGGILRIKLVLVYLFITPGKEVIVSVLMFACWQENRKTTSLIFTRLDGRVQNGPGQNLELGTYFSLLVKYDHWPGLPAHSSQYESG